MTLWQNIEKKKDILASLFFSFFLCPVIVCFELRLKQVFLEPWKCPVWLVVERDNAAIFTLVALQDSYPKIFTPGPACAPLPGCVRWCYTLTPHCVIEYSGNLGKIQRPSIVEAAA